MRPVFRVAVLTAALISQGALVAPALADEHGRVTTIAEGLNNPRGIDVGPDGTVYVAEAGAGGDECVTIGEGEEEAEACLGETSTVTTIAADGEVSTLVEGLPSLAGGEGEFVGAADVHLDDDGSLYVAMGLGGNAEVRDAVAADWEPAGRLGTLQRFADDTLTEVADLAQWEADEDPNAGQPSTENPDQDSNDSNPNGVLVTSDGTLLAVDAGGNTVLEIDPESGDITLRALIEDRMVPAPPFLGMPAGTELPMQSVPTNLAEGPAGEVAISELTGFPFQLGGARVLELEDDGVSVLEEGFTNAIDVAYLDGELYVLEIAHTSLLGGFEGALVRVREDGTRTALLRDQLVAPGGLAAGPDGMLYITNNSVGEPGSGSVLRFDPSLAADEAIQSACPPLEVAGTTLSDVADSTHEEAITCAAWHGLFSGFADGSFGPADAIGRGQLASVIARLVRATGAELATGEEGQFSDVDGTTHAEAINDLAAAGLVAGFSDGTFDPVSTVSRAQAVSMLVAAYEFATDAELEAGGDAFDDVGATHGANVEAAAAMGWVVGTSEGTFSPDANISRGQMASIVARTASDLVDGGLLELPA